MNEIVIDCENDCEIDELDSGCGGFFVAGPHPIVF